MAVVENLWLVDFARTLDRARKRFECRKRV
jgi:hypothetical protein